MPQNCFLMNMERSIWTTLSVHVEAGKQNFGQNADPAIQTQIALQGIMGLPNGAQFKEAATSLGAALEAISAKDKHAVKSNIDTALIALGK